jgi:hypothetical protein
LNSEVEMVKLTFKVELFNLKIAGEVENVRELHEIVGTLGECAKLLAAAAGVPAGAALPGLPDRDGVQSLPARHHPGARRLNAEEG